MCYADGMLLTEKLFLFQNGFTPKQSKSLTVLDNWTEATHKVLQWWIQQSQRGARVPTYYLAIFCQKCMKMKETGPKRHVSLCKGIYKIKIHGDKNTWNVLSSEILPE